jgi:hypothetical protein
MPTIESVQHIQAQRNISNSEGRQAADAAVKDKVNREIVGALAKQRQGNTMAYRGDKPAEMMRCLQEMEQHYRAALEEKVWEMFEMREANEALAKSVSDTQISRAKEIAIAKAREEEWNRHEARMHEAEETALRLQTRVRALLKYEELYNSSRVEITEMVRSAAARPIGRAITRGVKLTLPKPHVARVCLVRVALLQTKKLGEARKGRLASEDELGEVKLTLEQARNGWEMQREDLRHTIEKTNSENRVLKSEVAALTLSLENREAELARWSKSLGAGPDGDASLEGGLAQAEQERANLRQEIRGLHNALEHKDLQMAILSGQMDMLLAVINGSATLMVRHGGGHEKLFKHLMQKCKEEEHKRQREAAAAARTAVLDRRVALEALRKRGVGDQQQATGNPDTAEAVGSVLASTMGVSFPESFYERLAKEPQPVPLGGSSDAKHTQSRETQPTAADTSASHIHSFLFHSIESYPHALMVKAYMPPDVNEQHARDEEVEAELIRQEVEVEMSAEFAPSPRSSQGGNEISPTASSRRQDTMRSSNDSTVHLLGGRAARVASGGGSRKSGGRSNGGGLTSSFADSYASRSGPDPADIRASQSLAQSQRLPSGEMSAVLSSLQSLHASAHFDTPTRVEGGGMPVPHDVATGGQAQELMSLLRDMRQEMREMDEQRQRDSDSMKMQMALVLEGNGELAEAGRKQLRLGQEVSDMVSDMRQMQVESKTLTDPSIFDCQLSYCAMRTDQMSRTADVLPIHVGCESHISDAGLSVLALPWNEREGPISGVGQRDSQFLDRRHNILDSIDAIEQMDFDTKLRGETVAASS